MHILDISINALRRSRDGKRVLGDVTFQIDAKDASDKHILRVSCDTPYSQRIRPDAILIGDAIRQVRRLPAIREGEDRLTFARGLRPLSQRGANMDTMFANG